MSEDSNPSRLQTVPRYSTPVSHHWNFATPIIRAPYPRVIRDAETSRPLIYMRVLFELMGLEVPLLVGKELSLKSPLGVHLP
jgi:hypothetical protein